MDSKHLKKQTFFLSFESVRKTLFIQPEVILFLFALELKC